MNRYAQDVLLALMWSWPGGKIARVEQKKENKLSEWKHHMRIPRCFDIHWNYFPFIIIDIPNNIWRTK